MNVEDAALEGWEPDGETSQQRWDRKRAEARKYRAETGSMPSDWPFGVAIETLAESAEKSRTGRAAGQVKFPGGVNEIWGRGMKYIRDCIAKEWFPCKSGLFLSLGFNSQQGFDSFLRGRPEFREVFGQLIWLLSLPLEQALAMPGFNPKGLIFRLENLPGVLEADDDVKTVVEKPWQARPSMTIALDPSTLKVQMEDRPASEIYREMLKRGRMLEDETPVAPMNEVRADEIPV